MEGTTSDAMEALPSRDKAVRGIPRTTKGIKAVIAVAVIDMNQYGYT
jgi:hypothetical protein